MIIIRLQSDLGNQMFQYALYLSLKNKGFNVLIDDYDWFNSMLNKVHKNLSPKLHLFPKATYKSVKTNILAKLNFALQNRFSFYQIPIYHLFHLKCIQDDLTFMEEVLFTNNTYLIGYWQSEQYFSNPEVQTQLRHIFQLAEDHAYPKEYVNLEKEIQASNSVALHIRRTDYLSKGNREKFGNICTEAYYDKAITYIKEHVENPKFFGFSDDVEYLKDLCEKRGIIPVNLNRKINDVEEMMLMSKCKHFIIANSTYSWWASWLNENPNKNIIAPEKWINTNEFEHIYTPNMIRISADGNTSL